VAFVTLDAPRKEATKSFQCSKAIDQCEESYKTLFSKVFHILVYLPYSNWNMLFFEQTHSKLFYTIFFTQKGIPFDYVKTTFSLLVATLYSMFNMQ